LGVVLFNLSLEVSAHDQGIEQLQHLTFLTGSSFSMAISRRRRRESLLALLESASHCIS